MDTPEDILGKKMPDSVPFHQEMLERDSDFRHALKNWISGNEWFYFQKLIREAFIEGELTDSNFIELNQSMSNGFIILWHEERFERDSMSFLADALKERILATGYQLYMSDVRKFNRPDYVETVERHYLKPAITTAEGLADQIFGNITIEHRIIDEQPYDIRLMVHYYHDSKFSYPKPYPMLLEWLCSD